MKCIKCGKKKTLHSRLCEDCITEYYFEILGNPLKIKYPFLGLHICPSPETFEKIINIIMMDMKKYKIKEKINAE